MRYRFYICKAIATFYKKALIVFKSIGTALQDLALAASYYERLRDVAGIETGVEVASLKPKA